MRLSLQAMEGDISLPVYLATDLIEQFSTFASRFKTHSQWMLKHAHHYNIMALIWKPFEFFAATDRYLLRTPMPDHQLQLTMMISSARFSAGLNGRFG